MLSSLQDVFRLSKYSRGSTVHYAAFYLRINE
jgi:hypothetical protein